MHPDYAMHDVLSFEGNVCRGHCLETIVVGSRGHLCIVEDFRMTSWNLWAVFDWLRKANPKLKPKECNLFVSSEECLGHVLDQAGVRPSCTRLRHCITRRISRT